MATRYPNRDYERRRRGDPVDREEERDGMWLCVSVAKLGVERSDYEIIRE
jgi:hypothetical protein